MNFLKSFLRFLHSLIMLLLLIIIVIFMVNNRSITNIELYPLPYEIETRTFIVMISFFVIGMVFGILLCSQNLIRKIFENFKARRKIKKLESQIIN